VSDSPASPRRRGSERPEAGVVVVERRGVALDGTMEERDVDARGVRFKEYS
jgi:hypothetical protein|tara:strand:- start:657 stop:809 length:153 start_codon:yes stop_codon:yes gene_type:complete